MDDRLNELEARYALLERHLQELSEVVYRQERDLQRLSEVTLRLELKLRAEPGLVESATQERPPHY